MLGVNEFFEKRHNLEGELMHALAEWCSKREIPPALCLALLIGTLFRLQVLQVHNGLLAESADCLDRLYAKEKDWLLSSLAKAGGDEREMKFLVAKMCYPNANVKRETFDEAGPGQTKH